MRFDKSRIGRSISRKNVTPAYDERNNRSIRFFDYCDAVFYRDAIALLTARFVVIVSAEL